MKNFPAPSNRLKVPMIEPQPRRSAIEVTLVPNHGRDLHLVMGPAARGTSVGFRVLVDGHPPGDAHGLDIDHQGLGMVSEQRLYQLIRQPKSIADRQLEIEFVDSGVEAFVFTFG
jgi:hypothetical protein